MSAGRRESDVRERMRSGGLRGLQILVSGASGVRGGFDSHAFPPSLLGERAAPGRRGAQGAVPAAPGRRGLAGAAVAAVAGLALAGALVLAAAVTPALARAAAADSLADTTRANATVGRAAAPAPARADTTRRRPW